MGKHPEGKSGRSHSSGAWGGTLCSSDLLCHVQWQNILAVGPTPPSLRAGCHQMFVFSGQCSGPDFFRTEQLSLSDLISCVADLERNRALTRGLSYLRGGNSYSKLVNWHSGVRDQSL